MATKRWLRRWWKELAFCVALPVWLGSCAVGKMYRSAKVEEPPVVDLWPWTGDPWVSAQTND